MWTPVSGALRRIGAAALNLLSRDRRDVSTSGAARTEAAAARRPFGAVEDALHRDRRARRGESDDVPAPGSLPILVTLAVVAACLLASAPLIGFGVWGMMQVDARAAEREETLLREGFALAAEAVSREQQSVTHDNDAVLFAGRGDGWWMDATFGRGMHEFYSHDLAFVLDAADRPIYAMAAGRAVPAAAAAFAREEAVLAPLIDDLRLQLEGAEKRADLVARDLLMIGGGLSVVSVKAIVPESKWIDLAPGQERLHVAVRHIDARFLDTLERRFQLQDIRLLSAPHGNAGAIPLTSRAAGAVGHLAWTPERPGRELVKQTLPGLAFSAVCLLTLVAALLVRLRRVAGQVVASETEARHLARHDTLTGLPNRALFNERIGQALGDARRDGRWLALHYVDLDRFKHVNDTLGHPAGDELIRQVGERLRRLVRDGDTVARLGGDEFAIIQRDLAAPEDARDLAGRVLREIKAPFVLDGDLAYVDASIGIAVGPDGEDGRTDLMRKADIALYEAKGSGKGRFRIFEPELDDVVRLKRTIERDLREALETGGDLRVSYQPLYSADGATLVGAEALLRWNHPSHGMLSPAMFVAVAEERGLMPRLGAWVLREACRTAKELDLPWIAVNVSAVQFREPDFVDGVLNMLKEIGLSPERLQLEITESLLLDATDALATALTTLRFAGVCIALDDFGTGYSSLHYLNRYKVDKIKIDRSFVQALGRAEDSDAIVQAMMDLAQALRLEVTAEGVETQDQWEALNALGSAEMQGYLFSEPMDRAALGTLLARSPRRGAATRSA